MLPLALCWTGSSVLTSLLRPYAAGPIDRRGSDSGRRWAHGTNHGDLDAGRESTKLQDFDPTDFASLHLLNLVTARMGGHIGIGILEQACFGPHAPLGLTGLNAGFGV